MPEQEIRAILQRVCERLARRMVVPVGKVAVPVALGVGLATGTGCEAENKLLDTVTPDAIDQDNGVQPLYATPDAAYMGPDAGQMDVVDPGAVDIYGVVFDVVDPGPQPEYMGPDAAYMGPDPGHMDVVDPGAVDIYGVVFDVEDLGPQPEYMAPDVVDEVSDPGAQPPYMAPDAGTDLGPQPEYMAPDVVPLKDAEEDAVDPGVGTLYAAP